jgi:tetratricopeptide (TPR) repeat protein
MNDIELLKEAASKNQLVFFIGAGCSMPLGYPSWQQLVAKILQELDNEHGNVSDLNFKNILNKVGDNTIPLLDVLEKIENDPQNGIHYKAKAKRITYDYLNSIPANTKLSKIHPLLWSISEKIVTTNYDKLIESHKPHDAKVFDNLNTFQAYQSHDINSKFLYKIHGDIDNLDSLTLFKSDYDLVYDVKDHNHNTFSSIVKDKMILFLGFSLADPYVTDLLKYVNSLYGNYTNAHYILTTKNEDFTQFNVKTIKIKNWDEGLIEILEKLDSKLVSSSSSPSVPIDATATTQSSSDDISALIELINEKKKEVKKKPTKELIAEIQDIQKKLNDQLFGDLNYQISINAEYKNADLRSLFDKIYSTEKIDKETYDKIHDVMNNIELYKWHDRSVIVSAVAASLIHFNTADSRKINLLIDFAQSNENRVWQKAITSLFIVLNQLGNKWLRFSDVKEKLKFLTKNSQIQEALSQIILLFYMGYNRYSLIGERIFKNSFFEEPFNYFLPFYDDNSSLQSIYDNYEKEDIEKYIEELKAIPIPDQLKYLICENRIYNTSRVLSSEEKNSKEFKLYSNLMKLTYGFYPFSIYVHELINFYNFYPLHKHEKKLNVQFKAPGNSIKDYLLSEGEKYRALAMHFATEKNWKDAIHNWNLYLKLAPKNIFGLMNLAMCLWMNGEKRSAINKRFEIEKLDPDNEDNLVQIADYFTYDRRQGKHERLMEYADKLLNLNTKKAYYHYYKAIAFWDNEDYTHALEEINIAISIDEKDARYYSRRGIIYGSDKQYKLAVLDFNTAIELSPNEFYYYNRAKTYIGLNDDKMALSDLSESLKLKKNAYRAYLLIAEIKGGTGDIDGAFASIKECEKLCSPNFDLYIVYAKHYMAIKNFKQSISYLEKAKKYLNPDDFGSMYFESDRVMLLSLNYIELRDRVNTLFQIEELLKNHPHELIAKTFNTDELFKDADFASLARKYNYSIGKV